MRRVRGISVCAAVVLIAVGAAAWTGVDGQRSAPHRDAQPERIMHSREVFDFKTLPELLGTTPTVVEATVTDVRPGRTVGSAEEGGVEQARDVTLSVTNVLRSVFRPPTTLVLEEWGWDSEGNGYQVENVAWSEVGDKGFYFLTRSDDESRWRLVNSQGRALVKEGWTGLVSSADPESEIHGVVAMYQPDEFAFEIKRLQSKENQGELKPQAEPPVLTGPEADLPASGDDVEEPIPDDSTDDGSEPTPYPSSS
ncbi:hypothetical protein [Streptomyces sp. NPDC051662]|uniref:hypothetical protein n=1 Tax=Streptomyces sp. NPDC051662 TaxID=3154750 RepID=UPI00342DF477